MKKYIIINFVLGVFFSVCYATNDGNASIDPKEYDKMLKYIEKYNPKEKDIVQTIYSKDGEIYDCIDFYKQSSLKEVDKKTFKFPKPPKSVTKALIDRSGISAENTQLSDLLFPVTCPNDTVGIRRMTMDELTKFKTLDDYIASFNLKKNYQKKVSSESDTNTIPEPALAIDETKRLHSIVTFFKTNIGTASNINIWKHNGMDPSTTHLSISQVWVMRGVNEGAADRERIEVGVIKSQHNDFSVLFLFYDTQDDQWGFYNGTGSNNGFTLVDPSPIKIGEELPDYSIIGGHQAEILVAVYREQTQGHWWVWIHDRWIGFYNTNLWHENGLKHEAYQIDFGGEIMTMGTDMGSGRLPDEGYGYAAYQRNIRYVNKDTGGFTKVESAMERTRYPECYDVTFTNSTSSTWGSYIYFGGSAEDPRCETYPY